MNKGIKAAVMDFMVSRAGVPTSSDLVAAGVGITKSQAAQSLASLVTDGNADIVRVSNGIYSYDGPIPGKPASPSPSPSATRTPSAVFRSPSANGSDTGAAQNGAHAGAGTGAVHPRLTIVGRNKAGELLVADSNGVVYRLVEV